MMDLETFFSLANGWALMAWLVLILAPRGPKLMALLMYLGVFLLCLAYAVLAALLLSGQVDGGGSGEGASFTSLAGVMALFAAPAGAMVGWLHYLAFDLFTGMWIARDADHKKFSRIWQAPILVLTFMAGPLGLLIWLVVRDRAARAMNKANA